VYLKSLKLVGFKSFADRTHLEFRSGVTVIVGPNGSGKSNLVDALSWVMGTQSTKALRTGKMEDVVFAGTATRPSLNRAEATLIIDNKERMLGLDLDEVSLTRRLYRDGSSDYEINGVAVRLLDIHDLLSDSGVGRHQHVIIGQGEIGKVLNASPEDHRAVIEEAAGILKHRRRKEKSERRLERTDEDVLRLQDLLGEIERQMRPLRRQARAAARYDGLKGEVRDLTLYLAGSALEEYESEIAQLSAEQEEHTGTLLRDDARVSEVAVQLSRLTEEAAAVGADLDRDTSAAALLETSIERMKRLASVAHERGRAVMGRKQAAVERRADLEEESVALAEELVEVGVSESDASSSAQTHEDRFRRLEDEERALSTQTALSPEGALAAVRGELSALEATAIRDGREAEAITHRLDVVAGQLRDEIAEIAHINEEVRSADEEVSQLQATYEKERDRRTADQEAWTEAESQLTEARLVFAAAEARLDAVHAAVAGRSDLEARAAIEKAAGATGALVARLDVPQGLEMAVDAALGRWADAVVFESPDSLQQAVEVVKSAGGGGVPVVTDTGEAGDRAGEVAEAAGVETLLSRLGGSADRQLAGALLGDVLLVEGWTTAWSLVSRHPDLRAVTPEGDLVSVQGIQIAHADGAGHAMLESAEVGLERAQTAIARTDSIHTASKRDFDQSRERERSALEDLEQEEAGLAGMTEAMSRLQKSVDAHEEEHSRLISRKRSLTEGASDREAQTSTLRERLSALEGEEAERMRIWEELEAKRVAVAADREVARSEWQESATRLRGIVERRRLLEERTRRIVGDLERLASGPVADVDSSLLERIEAYSRRSIQVLTRRLEELRERQTSLRTANASAVSELAGARGEYEELRNRVAEARERSGQIEVRLTELRMLRESAAEQVRRDADSDIETARQASRPDYPDDSDLAQVLEEKAAQLRRLGPINPLAAAEFSELEERHTFLADQLADVESSRAELRKVIKALEGEIQNRFEEAFAEVSEAYQRYFGVLFPGGKGRIRFEDPDDPHSGLLIDAQPLGKKVSSMTLLSGGERSLAALAFLFSIFDARPSPFYVLDEVEAALDDANLRRFLRIVDEFRQQAQLLIVTHQQQTMEAADVLYGVTMEPGGSSRAVRKDMTRVGVERVA
jgi:chromosome segregation protein